MRISTTSLTLICAVFFFGSVFKAVAQPVFTVTERHHTCGPGNPATGSFTIRVTAASGSADLTISYIGSGPPVVTTIPMPSSFPFDYTVPGLTGTTAGRTYFVVLTDTESEGPADFINPVIFNFSITTATVVHNTNPTCTVPNGSITPANPGSTSSPPFVYSWTGPSGFTANTKDITGLKGGDYTLTYSDSNTPATSCTFGPVHINDPAPPAFTISSPDANLCLGETLIVTVSATDAAWTYQVLESATILATQVGTGSAMNIPVPGLSATNHTIRVRAVAGSCPSVFNSPFDLPVTVNPIPTYTTTTVPAVCGGTVLPSSLDLINFKGGASIVANEFTIQAVSFGALQAGAGNPTQTGDHFAATVLTDDVWINETAAPISVVYDIIPVTNTCPGPLFKITVPIDPQPNYDDFSNTSPGICSRDALGVMLDPLVNGASFTATTYNINDIQSGALTIAGGSPAFPVTGVTSIEISDDQWENVTDLPINVVYEIEPVSNNGCVGLPFFVTVAINPQPDYSDLDNTVTGVCSNVALALNLNDLQKPNTLQATSFNITVNPNGAVLAFGGPADGPSLPANSLMDDQWRNTTTADIIVEYTIEPVVGASCEGNTFSVKIAIKPEPVYINTDRIICSDEATNFNLSGAYSGGATGVTFDITINSNGLTPKAGSPADGDDLADDEIEDDAWENLTQFPVNVDYFVIPVSANGCEGQPFRVRFQVNPEPDFKNYADDNDPDGICSGDLININLSTLAETTSVAADSYEIQSVVTSDPLLTRVGGPAPTGTGFSETAIANDSWINASAGNQTVTYNIFPYNGICKGDLFQVVVTYVPRPSYADYTDAVGICAVPVGIDLNSLKNLVSPLATKFDIVANAPGLNIVAGGPADGTGVASSAIADDVWSNTSAGNLTVEYTITPYNGDCPSLTPFKVTITIKPQPDYAGTAVPFCSDVAFAVDLTLLKAGPSAPATSFDVAIAADPQLVNTATTPQPSGNTTTPSINDKWQNRTTGALLVTYSITPYVNACAGAPFDVVVTINPEPVYQVPSGATPVICSGAVVNIDLSGFYLAGETATTFDISAASVPVGLLPLGASTAFTDSGDEHVIENDQWTNVTNGPLDIVYTVTPKSAIGCAGPAFVVRVTISPEPDYTDFPVTNICSGGAINLNLDNGKGPSSVLASIYTVTQIDAPLVIAVAPAGPRALPFDVAANGLATDIWQNVTAIPQDVIYYVIPKNGTCAGDQFKVTVTITPEPVYNGSTNSVGICSDLPIGVDLTGLQGGSSVLATSFTVSAVSFGALVASSNVNLSGTINATDLSNDQWINTSAAVIPVTYSIIPLNGTCAGQPFDVTVNINPEPVGGTVTVDICDNTAVGVDLQLLGIGAGNNLANVSFQWVATDNPSVDHESLLTDNAPTITDVLENLTSIVQQVEYTVTPTSDLFCQGDPFKVFVNVYPTPVIEPGQSVEICSGSSVAYSIKMLPPNMPVGTTFEWPDPDGGTTEAGASLGPIPLGPGGTLHLLDIITVVGPVDYVVTPKVNGGLCLGSPEIIHVDVQQPAFVAAGPDQAICVDNGAFDLAGASKGGSASFVKWSIVSEPSPGHAQLSPPAGTQVADPATTLTSFLATIAGDYVLQIETDDPAGACGAVFDFVTITVTDRPVLEDLQSALVCANDPVNYAIRLTPAGVPLNTVFAWADPDAPGNLNNATASPVGGVPMGAPGTLHIVDVLRNTSAGNVDVFYDVTPSVGLCVGTQKRITITVKPAPSVVFDQKKTICSGEPVDFEILLEPASFPPNTTFSWPDPDGSGPATSKQDIAAGAPGTLHITDVLYNASGAPIDVRYDVISKGANGCFGITRAVTITVTSGAIAEAGPTQTICSGTSVKLSGSSVTGAPEGTWDVFTNPGDGAVSVTTSTATPDQVEFTATVGGTYVLRLTSGAPAGACSPVSDFVTIVVRAVGDPSCSGGPIGCPTDIIPDTTNATCNNTDGGVEFLITPALPPSGDVKVEIAGPTPKTQFASVDGLTFTNLAVGQYTYTVEYGGICTNNGTFQIDRSGTVGDIEVTEIQEPDCFGGTGSAILSAENQLGNTLEWSNTGTTWNSFLAGTRVDGLPAGTNLVFVRRAGDACASVTTLVLSDPEEITATFTLTDASCNNNDGAILVNNLAGGTGPYTFTVNDVQKNLPADNTFAGLTADDYTIVVTDSKGCVKTFNPVLISFPGFVNTTAPVTTAPDCLGGGVDGKVQFTITDPGTFEFALTTADVIIPPTSFNALGGTQVSASNLAIGDYAVWLRPVGSGLKCATKVPFTIAGIYAVSYAATTSDVICFAEPTSIVLKDIKGAPALPYSYTLTNTNDNSVTTGTISASQALSAFSLTNINPGNYSVLLTQDQSTLASACTDAISGGAKALVIDGPDALLDSLYVDRQISFPDLPSGSAIVGVSPSGLAPYETRLELTSPMFGGQEFVSDWSNVGVNPLNLKYEKQYSNLFAGQYTLGIRDAGGCERTYVFILNVDTQLFIPNIFTPNGDGHNEVFYIRNLPNDSKLLITNRWGKEVFKSSSYQNDWNGGDTVDGMYYYTLSLGGQSYTGWIEILRGQ